MYEIEAKVLPKYALNLAEDGRVLSVTFSKYALNGQHLVDELPEGDIVEYLYIKGEFIHDPMPKPEPVQPEPTTEDILNTLLGL